MGTNNEEITLSNGGVRERLIYFAKYSGMTVRSFEQAAKLSQGYVKGISKSIGADKLNNILSRFHELNRDWLLYGDGEMLKTSTSENENKNDNSSASNGNSSASSTGNGNLDKYLDEIRGERELVKTTIELIKTEKDQSSELLTQNSELITQNAKLINQNTELISYILKIGGKLPLVEGE
ncbi:MAG: hypothetical protein LUC37_02905 [Prevotella sp.]|nr:hypothetical protein [Prevotella sp.]